MDKYSTLSEEYGELELSAADKNITSELSGDFSLPDYQPEIKRLLRVTASMLPPSKFFGAGEAEFTGNIDYYVLYMGSDNEVYCAPLTGEYSVGLSIENDGGVDLGDELMTVVQITPEAVSGRVTSPRHITIKCRLRTHARIYGRGRIISDIKGTDGGLEMLRGEAENARLSFGTGEMLTLSDEIIPDSGRGEFRVVCADGQVLASEVSSGKDEVICRGEVHLKLMLGSEDGEVPTATFRRIPFSSIIPCDGATPESSAYAKGTLAELTVTVEEGRILIECGILLECVCQNNQRQGYIADMYSTENTCECEYRELTVPRGICAFNRNLTLGESMTLDEAKISAAALVADTSASATVDGCVFEGGKCRISGRCKFNLQLFDGGDYTGTELEFPFKYEYELPRGEWGEDMECDAEAGVVFCRARVDGERIGLDAEISLCGRVWENTVHTVLDSFRLGERLERGSGEVVVCYPGGSDTLWSVAKRYNASIDEIVNTNKLQRGMPLSSERSLDGVEYLVL